MKKLLHVIGIALALFTFGACQSEESFADFADQVVATEEPGLLKRMTRTVMTGEVMVQHFEYNGDYLKSIVIENDREIRFYYTGDLVTTTEVFVDGAIESTDNYAYDTQNRLVSYKSHQSGIIYTTNFEYYTEEGVGYIYASRFEGGAQAQSEAFETTVYELQDGEIVRQRTGSYIVEYTHDAKLSPFFGIKGYTNLAFIYYNCTVGSENNVSQIRYSWDGEYYNEVQRSLEYNKQGYPTQLISNDPLDGFTEWTTYEYN